MPETDELAPETDESDGSEEESSPSSGDAGGGAPRSSRPSSSARRKTRPQADFTDRATEQAAKLAGPEAAAVVKTINKAERRIIKNKNLRTAIKFARGLGPVGTSILVVGIVVFLLIIIVIMATSGGAGVIEQDNELKISKTGPNEAKSGDELPYEITVSYPKQAIDIVITDRIPDGTEYIDSSPPAKFDQATRVATWNLKDYQASPGAILNSVNITLLLKLRATVDNSFLVNRAEGAVTPYTPPVLDGGGGPIAEGFVPAVPHANDCGGKWDFSVWPNENPLGNYGDPQCNFSKDNLYNHLKAKEPNPEFVNIWFDMIVPVESVGYQPNAFAPPVGIQCSLDCAGAWGLYQMGSSKPAGQPPPAPGKNGPLDRGDVNWEVQTEMAIRYNRELLGCNFEYWASARSIWGVHSC